MCPLRLASLALGGSAGLVMAGGLSLGRLRKRHAQRNPNQSHPWEFTP